jgi:hypothetical protein
MGRANTHCKEKTLLKNRPWAEPILAGFHNARANQVASLEQKEKKPRFSRLAKFCEAGQRDAFHSFFPNFS